MMQRRQHPWARLSKQIAPAPPPRPRNAPELIGAVLSALATASSAEVAVMLNLTRGRVAGIVHRARAAGVEVITRPRPNATGRASPKARPVSPAPPALTPAPALVRSPMPPCEVVTPHVVTLSLLDAEPCQCRALDDDGHCCGRVTWSPRSSWCAEHRALYQSTGRRVRVREYA